MPSPVIEVVRYFKYKKYKIIPTTYVHTVSLLNNEQVVLRTKPCVFSIPNTMTSLSLQLVQHC